MAHPGLVEEGRSMVCVRLKVLTFFLQFLPPEISKRKSLLTILGWRGVQGPLPLVEASGGEGATPHEAESPLVFDVP